MDILIDILLAAFIAMCFNLWPITGKVLQLGPWSALLAAIGTGVTIIAFSWSQARNYPVTQKAVLLMLGVSVLNGIGMSFYGLRTQKDDADRFIALVVVLMIILAPIIKSALDHSDVSYLRITCFALAGAIIYFAPT